MKYGSIFQILLIISLIQPTFGLSSPPDEILILSSGTINYPNMEPSFSFQGTTLSIKHFHEGYRAYIPNSFEIIKDLKIDTIRVFSAGFKEFSLIDTPSWAQNLENFLTLCDSHGIKVIFHQLGGWNSNDPMFGIFPGEDIETSKEKIEMLAGNNSLGKNFINDPRIPLWIIANEPDLNQPSATPGAGISDMRDWCLQISDYIKLKGANVAIGNPRVEYYNDPSLVVPIIRDYVTHFIWHCYGYEVAIEAQNNGGSPYNASYKEFEKLYKDIIAQNISMQKVLIGELGMRRDVGGTEETRGKYYRAAFQSSVDFGIEGVFPFTLFDVDVPGDIAKWGAIGLDLTYYTNVTNQYRAFYQV
jgi:hypothetical protein